MIRARVANIWRRAGLINSKDYYARAAAILRFIQRKCVYVHEPIETFTRPRRMIGSWSRGLWWLFGDCDEFTSVEEALFQSAGFPTQREAIGWSDHFAHVYAVVGLPPGGRAVERWLCADGTVNKPLGWSPLRWLRRRKSGIVVMRRR